MRKILRSQVFGQQGLGSGADTGSLVGPTTPLRPTGMSGGGGVTLFSDEIVLGATWHRLCWRYHVV